MYINVNINNFVLGVRSKLNLDKINSLTKLNTLMRQYDGKFHTADFLFSVVQA